MSKWIKNWFSNMALLEQPLEIGGHKYLTVENAYQALKSLSFGDRYCISKCLPLEAKKFTRMEHFSIREDWDKLKLPIMYVLLCYKFAPGTIWHRELRLTHDEVLVETNNWRDTYWGMPARKINKTQCSLTGKPGQNWLGRLLMLARDEEYLTSLYFERHSLILSNEASLKQLGNYLHKEVVCPTTDTSKLPEIIDNTTLPSKRV